MVLKRLPLDVQSIFCASTQIKTYKTAVQELVYNALDANSTSIAIRVNIQENYLQLVDNGDGVSKDDFQLLGQRYTTSRYEDSITCTKSIQKYGHSGQSLANIIQISQSVKITSRCKNSEETWVKHFYNGKEKECLLTSARPSIGSTIEIKGFLYNLTIQNKSVKALQELQKINTFLEQMSLVHCNTSISLRDNSENKIIFKIHKNRDIYQTFSSLLGIEKSNLQELQVEKKQYKVTGFIQKQDTDSRGFQWIFVNKRFIDNSNLHKIINQNLVKSLPIKRVMKTKILQNHNDEDKITTNNKIPDYFIFIKCPRNDYEILSNPKQSMLEFKNFCQINTLLEKLTKFYNSDISLTKKTIAKIPVEEEGSHTKDTNTRNQVKIIIEKILGSQHNKINGSQLHNGVKGKNIKRKMKKKVENKSKLNMQLNPKDKDNNRMTPPENNEFSDLIEKNKQPLKKAQVSEMKNNDCAFKIPKKKQIRNRTSTNTEKEQKLPKEITPHKNKKSYIMKDSIISKFEKETGEVQKRCQILAKKVDNLLAFKRKRKCKVFTNEYVQYSTVVRDSKKMTIRKKIDEVIIHEYLPLRQKTKPTKRDCNIVMKSDDLLRPVTATFEQTNVQINQSCANTLKQQTEQINVQINESCANTLKQTDVYYSQEFSVFDSNIPRLTYESHCYAKNAELHHTKHKVFEKNKDNDRKFISHVSQDNFLSPKKRKKAIVDSHFQIPAKKNTANYKQADASQFSFSIHFTETGSRLHETPNITPIVSDITPAYDKSPIGSTYTIIDSDKPTLNDVSPNTTIQNASNVHNFQETYSVEALHDSKYSIDEAPNDNDAIIKSVTPNICETFCVKETQARHFYNNQCTKHSDLLKVNGTPEIFETYCMQASLSHSKKYTIQLDQLSKYHELQDLLNPTASFQEANNFNVIFISTSQQSDTEMTVNKDFDPVRICETVFDHQNAYENDEYSFIFNSINDITNEHNIVKPTELCETKINCNINKSHAEANILNGDKQDVNEQMNPGEIGLNNFNLKNRRRYIPKGMSPIFENCNTRDICNYELEKDYFQEIVYNNFAEDVQINSEIFGPRIQNVKELTTRDVERINNKLNKDNACLTFNGESLKQLQVLGQVDYKFIATKIMDKSKGPRDYLVLFDQHAVDERIRLEKNMAEYFDGDQWKSETLDGVSLKLTKDEILYLHNYKKKFQKLGLEWTILDNSEVSITAIPEAILGKNVRQAETVFKTVKSLIKEEINMIKEQGGCVSLYPKSIMDLVFSEACRYAIMFGDALSKLDCVGLLNALSECKTPFQCAHGRPVMAVLMDIRTEKHEYKFNEITSVPFIDPCLKEDLYQQYSIDFKKIQQFRRMQNLNK